MKSENELRERIVELEYLLDKPIFGTPMEYNSRASFQSEIDTLKWVLGEE
jgi:hypothetical protein